METLTPRSGQDKQSPRELHGPAQHPPEHAPTRAYMHLSGNKTVVTDSCHYIYIIYYIYNLICDMYIIYVGVYIYIYTYIDYVCMHM